MKSSFDVLEDKIYNYINNLQDQRVKEDLSSRFHNTEEYKNRYRIKQSDDAKNTVLGQMLGGVFVKSIPFNKRFKQAYDEPLVVEMVEFVKSKAPDGNLVKYFKEASEKGSTVAKKMLDGANDIANAKYKPMRKNIKDVSLDDMVFRMDDENQKKIDVLSRNLELDDVSELISDNVKNTAIAEIIRAQKEKKAVNDLEKQLADDPEITSESAIDSALKRNGFDKKSYNPSLFESMMIGNLKKIEDGNINKYYTYEAMSDYGLKDEESFEPSDTELAFIESVKELTKLSILKALKLESYKPSDVKRMAYQYTKG